MCLWELISLQVSNSNSFLVFLAVHGKCSAHWVQPVATIKLCLEKQKLSPCHFWFVSVYNPLISSIYTLTSHSRGLYLPFPMLYYSDWSLFSFLSFQCFLQSQSYFILPILLILSVKSHQKHLFFFLCFCLPRSVFISPFCFFVCFFFVCFFPSYCVWKLFRQGITLNKPFIQSVTQG